MTSDEGRPGRTRDDDHATSEAGARAIGQRAPNQRLRLLAQYPAAGETGLNAEEAAKAAGVSLRSCFWKRISELAQDRCIEELVVAGRTVTRKGDAGVDRNVYVLTTVGRAVLRAHELLAEDPAATPS
jgi:hypothetical protein